jgi:hypothetical protein
MSAAVTCERLADSSDPHVLSQLTDQGRAHHREIVRASSGVFTAEKFEQEVSQLFIHMCLHVLCLRIIQNGSQFSKRFGPQNLIEMTPRSLVSDQNCATENLSPQ